MQPISGSGPPTGLGALVSWMGDLHAGHGDHPLWPPLDDDLRMALAQTFILHTHGRPDDATARVLAARAPGGAEVDKMVDEMLAQCGRRWRDAYPRRVCELAPAGRSRPVGADMELVTLPAPAPGVRSFLTRWTTSRGWVIAALGHRLPVPGWPPTSWLIPHLRPTGAGQ